MCAADTPGKYLGGCQLNRCDAVFGIAQHLNGVIATRPAVPRPHTRVIGAWNMYTPTGWKFLFFNRFPDRLCFFNYKCYGYFPLTRYYHCWIVVELDAVYSLYCVTEAEKVKWQVKLTLMWPLYFLMGWPVPTSVSWTVLSAPPEQSRELSCDLPTPVTSSYNTKFPLYL